MKKEILGIVMLSSLLFAAGCGQKKSDIEGKWTLDLEATVAQARSIGATDRDIQGVRQTFEGGLMEIDASKITLSIVGMQAAEVRGYKVDSKAGSCVIVRIEPSPDLQRFCVEGRRLDVHDPSTKLVLAYNRS
jgi:hypothetical protein